MSAPDGLFGPNSAFNSAEAQAPPEDGYSNDVQFIGVRRDLVVDGHKFNESGGRTSLLIKGHFDGKQNETWGIWLNLMYSDPTPGQAKSCVISRQQLTKLGVTFHDAETMESALIDLVGRRVSAKGSKNGPHWNANFMGVSGDAATAATAATNDAGQEDDDDLPF